MPFLTKSFASSMMKLQILKFPFLAPKCKAVLPSQSGKRIKFARSSSVSMSSYVSFKHWKLLSEAASRKTMHYCLKLVPPSASYLSDSCRLSMETWLFLNFLGVAIILFPHYVFQMCNDDFEQKWNINYYTNKSLKLSCSNQNKQIQSNLFS